jgi:cellulose biosynthesis protein BcsQ
VWEFIVHIHGEYEPLIKFISYIVSPILAYLAFRANRRSHHEISQKSEELGRLSNEVDNAHAAIREKQHELQIAASEIEARGDKVAELEDDLRKITEGSQALWNLRPPSSFEPYRHQLWDSNGARIITVGNLKGGVGKTTVAANLAAYISETRRQNVLLIDLDYQGSLSNMLMLATEREQVTSQVDRLFLPDANFVTLDQASEPLLPKLLRAQLVTANYGFAQFENQLLLKWLLRDDGGVDVRFRLANLLLRPEVRQKYAAIILDMPPRMTLAAVNALVTSHWFVVPTVLDKLSVEAVAQFLTSMKALKADLGLQLDLVGIAGCMTRTAQLGPAERAALELARESGWIWDPDVDYVLPTIPRKASIGNAAGADIAYLCNDGGGTALKPIFDPLFDAICDRIGMRGG